MISWMQKNNKYLVWTIWVATLAFIGAGFVGWGSYSFGSKAGNIAKVGDIEIKQDKLNSAYSHIYNQYNQMLQGQMDDKKAEEFGLIQEAFKAIERQAKVLSFAKENGIIISDAELLAKVHNIESFQKDGKFNKEIYNGYLKSQRIKAKDFENSLKDEMIIDKTMRLLNAQPFNFEKEVLASAANVQDKIAYKVLSNNDVEFKLDSDELKQFWEENKDNFKTNTNYELSIAWVDSALTNVDETELQEYYATNSFNYTDDKGKQLSFEEAKEQVSSELKLKKSKKEAQKAYIAFKKSKDVKIEKLNLDKNDAALTTELWNAIKEKSIGDIIKPKVVGNSYAIVKIDNINLPKTKTFEEAKETVTELFTQKRTKELLDEKVKTTLNNFDNIETIKSEFISLTAKNNFEGLSESESFSFVKQLFASSMEKDSIDLKDKVVIYSILEQKVPTVTVEQIAEMENSVSSLKKSTLETNLIKELDKLYPTEVFFEGLTN